MVVIFLIVTIGTLGIVNCLPLGNVRNSGMLSIPKLQDNQQILLKATEKIRDTFLHPDEFVMIDENSEPYLPIPVNINRKLVDPYTLKSFGDSKLFLKILFTMISKLNPEDLNELVGFLWQMITKCNCALGTDEKSFSRMVTGLRKRSHFENSEPSLNTVFIECLNTMMGISERSNYGKSLIPGRYQYKHQIYEPSLWKMGGKIWSNDWLMERPIKLNSSDMGIDNNDSVNFQHDLIESDGFFRQTRPFKRTSPTKTDYSQKAEEDLSAATTEDSNIEETTELVIKLPEIPTMDNKTKDIPQILLKSGYGNSITLETTTENISKRFKWFMGQDYVGYGNEREIKSVKD